MQTPCLVGREAVLGNNRWAEEWVDQKWCLPLAWVTRNRMLTSPKKKKNKTTHKLIKTEHSG